MMETKKVEKVRENGKKSYDGRNGKVFVHLVTVEGDPQEYEYHSTKEVCEKFKPGEVTSFTTEAKVNGVYINHKITPIMPQVPFKGGGGFKDTKDQGLIAALSCVSSSVNHYQQRQATEETVIDFAEKMFKWANSKSSK